MLPPEETPPLPPALPPPPAPPEPPPADRDTPVPEKVVPLPPVPALPPPPPPPPPPPTQITLNHSALADGVYVAAVPLVNLWIVGLVRRAAVSSITLPELSIPLPVVKAPVCVSIDVTLETLLREVTVA